MGAVLHERSESSLYSELEVLSLLVAIILEGMVQVRSGKEACIEPRVAVAESEPVRERVPRSLRSQGICKESGLVQKCNSNTLERGTGILRHGGR